MPASRIRSSVSRSWSTVAPTQVKCAIASRPCSALIEDTMSTVLRFCTSLPPAPYVTETNVGFRRESSASARPRLRSPSSVRGGKNSNENDGSEPLARRSSIRIARSLGRPPLWGPRIVRRLAELVKVGQPAARLREQPRGRALVKLLAVDRLGELERRLRAMRERALDLLEVLGDEGAVGGDVSRDVSERTPVPGQREARVERLDLVERAEELADRVGGVAEVEVLRHAAEQVVAGDQQPAVRL